MRTRNAPVYKPQRDWERLVCRLGADAAHAGLVIRLAVTSNA